MTIRALSLQVLPQVLAFAFLLVSASTVAMIPVLQYMFGLSGMGWAWQHAALFAAMLGSTDCVAVSAVLKSGMSLPWCIQHPVGRCTLQIARTNPAWDTLD